MATHGVLLANGDPDESHARFGVGSGVTDSVSEHASELLSSSADRGSASIRCSRWKERVKKMWIAAVQKWPLVCSLTTEKFWFQPLHSYLK